MTTVLTVIALVVVIYLLWVLPRRIDITKRWRKGR